MSEQVSEPLIGAARQARESVGRVLDAQGNAIEAARREGEGALEQMRAYIREQPFSAALIALGIGYIIGRLRLL